MTQSCDHFNQKHPYQLWSYHHYNQDENGEDEQEDEEGGDDDNDAKTITMTRRLRRARSPRSRGLAHASRQHISAGVLKDKRHGFSSGIFDSHLKRIGAEP